MAKKSSFERGLGNPDEVQVLFDRHRDAMAEAKMILTHLGMLADEKIIGDLGLKMQHAIEEQLLINEKVCIIGTDCAELKQEHLESAFVALGQNDFVLGPANDGGYYLLGLKSSHPELYQNIDWSTEVVLSQTIDRIKSLKKSYFLLPELIDVDTEEDWNLVLDKFN